MSVRSAMHSSLQATLYVLAILSALVLLVGVLVFGAIFALAHRNRRPGFSYFASGMNAQGQG
jgi:hypothetical protein